MVADPASDKRLESAGIGAGNGEWFRDGSCSTPTRRPLAARAPRGHGLRSPLQGVVSLPAKLRRAAGIKPDDQLIAETTPEGILLRPAVTLAVEIYSDDRIRGFDVEEDKLAKVLAKRKPR